MVKGLSELDYKKRLDRLNLYKLERRRSRMRFRGDMMETFKIITELENINSEQLFVKSTTKLRGYNCKLFKKRANKICQKTSSAKELWTPGINCIKALLIQKALPCSSAGLTSSWTQGNMDNKSFIAYNTFMRNDDDDGAL